MQSEETYFRLKEISKYDNVPYVPFENRKDVMETKMLANSKAVVKGGTAATNPYKKVYDVVVAEKLARNDMYLHSKLWSPKFTPGIFKYTFLLPMSFIVSLCVYIHYVQTPKRMLHLKRTKGYVFKDLEKQGRLRGWLIEEYKDEIYGDDVMLELEEMTGSGKPLDMVVEQERKMQELRNVHDVNQETKHIKMNNKLNELYHKRKLNNLS